MYVLNGRTDVFLRPPTIVGGGMDCVLTVDRPMWCAGIKPRSHRSMSSGSGSTDRFVITWSAVDCVHGERSVGDLCESVARTSARPCQSLLTGQRDQFSTVSIITYWSAWPVFDRVNHYLLVSVALHVDFVMYIAVSRGRSLTSLLVTLGPPEFVNCGIGMGQSLDFYAFLS